MTRPSSAAPTPTQRAVVPETLAGRRLDQALVELFPGFSRARLQRWVSDGRATVDGRAARPSARVRGGESVELRPEADIEVDDAPQAMELAVVHRDEAILVIDKPPGLVVHPAAGNRAGTLLNGLLHLDPGLAAVPRAGLVHRLDKDTSGLLVVARTLKAHAWLVAELKARRIEREYDCVVSGVVVAGGTVDAPVGRHPQDRKRMAVTAKGRPAVSHYRVEEKFRAHTHLRVRLETGRTHQIRVHMAHIRHPLVGDPVYGGRHRRPPGCGDALDAALRAFPRQALHARRLALPHPEDGRPMEWTAPLPDDLRKLIAALRRDARAAGGGA